MIVPLCPVPSGDGLTIDRMGAGQKLYRFTVGNIRWLTINSDPEFLASVIQSLEQGTHLLRAIRHRRVLRTAGCPPLIVKHFSPQGIAAKLKTLIRRRPGTREWIALRKALRLGLPVPTPVALGWRNKGIRRESFVVTEALCDSCTLSNYLYGTIKPAVVPRWQVVRETALVIRKMHDAGIFHKDLHLDNLILRLRESSPTVYLIDFQRVGFYGSLSPKLRMHNLAALNGGCMEATRSERLRFLKVYLGGSAGAMGALRPLASRLEQMGKRRQRIIWRSRQKRCLAENREFTKIRMGAFVGVVRVDQNDDAIQAQLQDPEQLFSKAVIVTRSPGKTVGRVDLSDRAIYIARYHPAGVFHAIKNLFSSSSAQKGWLTGNGCLMRGIPVATPVAYLERHRGPFLLESYLINKTGNGRDLTEALAQIAGDIEAKRRLIDDFARHIARLHKCDVTHHNLDGHSIMVSHQGRSFVFSIVDYDSFSIGSVSWRTRIETLAYLAQGLSRDCMISKTDRVRFLRSYLGSDFDREWKRFGRRLCAKSV